MLLMWFGVEFNNPHNIIYVTSKHYWKIPYTNYIHVKTANNAKYRKTKNYHGSVSSYGFANPLMALSQGTKWAYSTMLPESTVGNVGKTQHSKNII